MDVNLSVLLRQYHNNLIRTSILKATSRISTVKNSTPPKTPPNIAYYLVITEMKTEIRKGIDPRTRWYDKSFKSWPIHMWMSWRNKFLLFHSGTETRTECQWWIQYRHWGKSLSNTSVPKSHSKEDTVHKITNGTIFHNIIKQKDRYCNVYLRPKACVSVALAWVLEEGNLWYLLAMLQSPNKVLSSKAGISVSLSDCGETSVHCKL